MKLLLIQPIEYLSYLDGASKANRALMEGLRARGHTCRVLGWSGTRNATRGNANYGELLRSRGITPRRETSDVVEFEHEGVDVWTVLNAFQWPAQLQRALEGFSPDCILVSEDHTLFLLEAALEATTVPVLYIAHSQASLPFGPESFVEDPSPERTELLRRASGIVTVSHYVRRYIEEYGKMSADVVYFPVYGKGPFPNLGRFDEGTVTIINPSSLKGISLFLELARRFPHVAFAAVPTWATSAEDLQALRALPNVAVWEPVERVELIYQRSRVLLSPSLWGEALGQVVVEAMLRGLPVLASDVGGLPEAKLGVDYLLPVRPIRQYERRHDARAIPVPIIPEQDVGPWARALEEVLSHRDVYERLSATSHQRAAEFIGSLSVEPFEQLVEGAVRTHVGRAAPAPREQAPSAARQLSPAKRALLAARLRKKNAQAHSIPSVARDDARARHPLSYSQERLWFLQQLDNSGSAYNTALTYRLIGRLDVQAMERSLDVILARHESLRARFVCDEAGKPFQEVIPHSPLSLRRVRVEGADRAQKEEHARKLLGAAVAERFELSRGSLLRIQLLELEPDEHLFVLVLHHILFDGWSAGVFARELCALYQAFSTGEKPSLPEPSLQYVDYAVWQRGEYDGKGRGSDLTYWRQKLGGQLPVLQLPIYRPRPKQRSFRGADATFVYPGALATRLSELGQQRGCTLFMVMLAAFNALLHRYTGDEDIIVGTLTANRERPELEALIGLFLNSLVLRTDTSGDPLFLELLDRVREVTLDAYAHQSVPVERLVEELQPQRDAGHPPLFQVLFVLQNGSTPALELGELRLEPLPFETTATDVDLEFQFSMSGEGLLGRVIYNTDLLDAASISRLMGQFQTLLEAIVQAPDTRLSRLPLVTPAEREHLLEQSRGPELSFSMEQGLLARIEQHARTRPEHVAVVAADGSQLTYGELSEHSSQLAAHLQALGVGPEVTVAVCLERSPRLLVALLAVLKAGGAYVPLDVDYPRERLEFMLQDSQARLLLTVRERAGSLPESAACPLVCMQELLSGASAPAAARPLGPVHGENAAYLIYTSGSTGTPKGVVVRHQGLHNYALTALEDYALGPADRVLQFASLSWDTSVEEIYPTLLAGATLVLRPRELPGSSSQFLEWCERQRLTLINLPTAFWHELAAELERRPQPLPPSLRVVVIGGEQASWNRIRAWRACMREGARLVNTYGCTEATAVSTLCDLSRVEDTGQAEPPMGRPIGNVRTYVLDADGSPVPPGVPGELCLAGEGVARGYAGKAALTAERFVPDPFSSVPGARMYRTGDLALVLPEGSLKYLGRRDAQVKMRGVRVELGEIEAVFSRHPAVAGVVLHGLIDGMGQKSLAAYVVAEPGQAPTPEALRQHAAHHLPSVMVPAHVVLLEEFPRTPSGKIDRRRLPPPDMGSRPVEKAPLATPHDELEQRLLRCWQEVLDRTAVGTRDDFFELGGHSLLAVRLITRVEREFGRRLSLAALLRGPTVERMAALLRESSQGGAFSVLVPLQSEGNAPPFFCIPGSGGNVLYLRELALRLGRTQPVYGLQSVGLDGHTPPLTRIEDMAAGYVQAILSIQPRGPYSLGGHSFGSHVAFEVAYQLEQLGHSVALVASLDNPAPFQSGLELPCASWNEAQWTESIVRIIERMFGVEMNLPYEVLAQHTAPEQLELLLERLRATGVFPPEARVEQVRGFVQVFKANTLSSYTPRGKLSAPVVLLRAEVFRREDVDARVTDALCADPSWGWSQHTQGSVLVHTLPGDHLTMLGAPHVDALAEALKQHLLSLREAA